MSTKFICRLKISQLLLVFHWKISIEKVTKTKSVGRNRWFTKIDVHILNFEMVFVTPSTYLKAAPFFKLVVAHHKSVFFVCKSICRISVKTITKGVTLGYPKS